MKSKISNQFMINYFVMFLLSILATVLALLMLSYSNNIISKILVKNIYTASSVMNDDYTKIDPSSIVENGGGLQIINENLDIIYSAGLSTFNNQSLSTNEFTQFLVESKSKGVKYSYDILYNEKGKFWIVVTFPTSIRLDISLVHNNEAASMDMTNVSRVFMAIIIFYLILLAIFTAIIAKVTALKITEPLIKLTKGTKLLRNGDYSTRVNLNLKNEFGQLQDTFNEMAEKIEKETSLRKQSEDDRKKMILDISHDLKNPLSSVVGYTELIMKNSESLSNDQIKYLQVIHSNGKRANKLLNELFELSKVDNPNFMLKLSKIEICEFMRQVCGDIIPYLEQNKFEYEFNIPDSTVYVMIDVEQMNRVFLNLAHNAFRYNQEGTLITVNLYETTDNIIIEFKDDGIGIPEKLKTNIFKPFVRVEDSRNSQTGGTGLGLSIAHKIVTAHGGTIVLSTENKGSTFIITLNKS